ncbi:hypothetical protein [Humisphaera borealis]|uniref:Uncharacterized protein n=1 Tax=Humisphaera borealis TaxID=2807512 RepID=A0A7M2WXD2_9BACT|nr:hypothetical protein [Humisphaera borealis]QOV90155.1 hypothetical protein IPV69_01915 [Humisphaera borealis]
MEPTTADLVESILALADLRARHAHALHRLERSHAAHTHVQGQHLDGHWSHGDLDPSELEVQIEKLRRRVETLSEHFAAARAAAKQLQSANA